ncbi:MAG: malonate transporter subunit MadM [Saprospiraceae bacterium]|nr:malonate transporter subunit MadM [Saprospiraceae bacterium]
MFNLNEVFIKNGLIVAFVGVGLILWCSDLLSGRLFRNRIPMVAIAILIALVIAYMTGYYTRGKNGIADLAVFSGFTLLGGSMLRDFTIVATAMNADWTEIKKAGRSGFLSLLTGILIAFFTGASIAFIFGYDDAVSMTTIGAGACTFIVGPVTGSALGASSEVITISIATGVVKAIVVTILTPVLAGTIKLNNPATAMVYGGLMGTTSGVAAGLAATNPLLVPYGALSATFSTGLGCLLCPSLFYLILNYFF